MFYVFVFCHLLRKPFSPPLPNPPGMPPLKQKPPTLLPGLGPAGWQEKRYPRGGGAPGKTINSPPGRISLRRPEVAPWLSPPFTGSGIFLAPFVSFCRAFFPPVFFSPQTLNTTGIPFFLSFFFSPRGGPCAPGPSPPRSGPHKNIANNHLPPFGPGRPFDEPPHPPSNPFGFPPFLSLLFLTVPAPRPGCENGDTGVALDGRRVSLNPRRVGAPPPPLCGPGERLFPPSGVFGNTTI